MKINYKIYEDYSGEMPEQDKQITEQIILSQVKESYEQPKRIVIRPKVSVWKDVLFLTVIIAAVVTLLVMISVIASISSAIFTVICVFCGFVYLAVFSKKLLITAIILYQKYAPEIVRSSCLFEPCCSEYMKISISKYGVRKGFVKGIKRIVRCRYPNGGVDEP